MTASIELAGTIGLACSIALASSIYRFGVHGMSQLEGTDGPLLSRRFVHTLVPITLAYTMAHYFSQLIFQGQALGYLASDPLGDGQNLLGTATWTSTTRSCPAPPSGTCRLRCWLAGMPSR